MKLSWLSYLIDNIWLIVILISIVTIFFICFEKYNNIKHERIKQGMNISKIDIISSRIGFFSISSLSLIFLFAYVFLIQ